MANRNGDAHSLETFCILPWVHLYSEPDGSVRPCCISLAEPGTVDRDADGEPYVIYSQGAIERAWNSQFMKELRQEMLAGKRPPACLRCFHTEDRGIRSYRQFSNEEFADRIEEVIDGTSEDGFSPPDSIRSIDLRLGNLCNLRCRMCSPESSKAIIKEWAHLNGMDGDDARLQRLKRLDWFSKEDLWRGIEKHVSSIEKLHFTGGEPMIIPQVADFLERVVAMGYARNITLSFISNLTVLPRRMLALWPHFKSVRLVASVDGFGEVNSFIRHPSNWATIDRNLKELDGSYKQLNLSSLCINTTVQVYNIFRLDALIEYLATTFSHVSQPALTLLTEPYHFNVRILPPGMKRLAAARLKNFIEGFQPRWPERWRDKYLDTLHSTVDAIITHMMSEDRSDLLPEFLRWTGHMDSSRRQNVLAVVPELAPLFKTRAEEGFCHHEENGR